MADHAAARAGPLTSLRVVEFAGIGPAPMCAMMLADLGADVVRIERKTKADIGIERPRNADVALRGRPSVALDLKNPEDLACAADLASVADAVIEGYRPGTMERLGLGPDDLLARNPKLVYGRVTGWGQTGPLAQAAGHDINYIAITGALDAIGRAGGPPVPPLNLLGDYAGGSMLLAFGIVSAVLEARVSGRGQVVDAAMVDGASLLLSATFGLRAAGLHGGGRGQNLLDSGAPNYDVYECADGNYISVGPIEPKFLRILLDRIGLDATDFPSLTHRGQWPEARRRLAERFITRSRDEWSKLLEGTDACVAPVLSLDEAPSHPHNAQRGSHLTLSGVVQPAPAPRFSRTPARTPTPPTEIGEGVTERLADWPLPDHLRKRLCPGL